MEWTRYEFSELRGARDNNFGGEKVERREGQKSRPTANSLRTAFSFVDFRDQSTLTPLNAALANRRRRRRRRDVIRQGTLLAAGSIKFRGPDR